MFNSDFVWLNFDEEFNSSNKEATRSFTIDEVPVAASQQGSPISAEGYILIQGHDVGNNASDPGDAMRHRILINGKNLPAFDMVDRDGWNLWMDRIPDGFLKKGQNRLTIQRRDRDTFKVANVVVHWRERRGSSRTSASDTITSG